MDNSQNLELVIKNAGRVATNYGNNQIGTEFLLYGITTAESTFAFTLLRDFAITSDALMEIFDESTEKNEYFGIEVELTPKSKEIIAMAKQIAMSLNHSFVGVEHLLLSIISNTNCFAVRLMQTYFNANLTQLKSKLIAYLQGTSEFAFNANQTQKNSNELPEKLLDMGYDVTLKAKQGKIDPIVGRESEIERIIEILCRKTKNNPILIGEAGVGKTAVVEGLAQAIVMGNVPEILKDKIVFSLTIGGLMAGTKYRGSMEEKLKDTIETIIAHKNIIVFIDEIHTLAQAGNDKGETNPADMLKPYLARGEFQTIGATTTEEYRKFLEKDKALERRFQPITVNPPSVLQTIEILKGLKDSYEAFHKVSITHEAIVAAATLSDRYIMDRNLPDKAIDLIDEASSKAKVNFSLKPKDVFEKEAQIKKLSAERDEASLKRDYEKCASLQSKIIVLEDQLQVLNKKYNKNTKSNSSSIDANDIAAVVAKWTGIPVTRITETEKEKLINLESILHKRVIGQDEAVIAVSRAIRRARIGIADAKKPIGSFLFMGQTGVGKTELCKAIAEAVFDNENNIIRIDMSEYMESHSVAKLIGAPPGYVGYDEGGQLTEQVRRKPYSVVLFDEIEKAHGEVFNMLLQVLDEGRLTDSQGRLVSFKNTIIIMTSNIGSNDVLDKNKLGFYENNGELTEKQATEKIYMEALRKKLKPEFINRVDAITVFSPLRDEDLHKIAIIMVSGINQRLQAQGLQIKITERALDLVVKNGSDLKYGARPLNRYIQHHIEDTIAEKILTKQLNGVGTVVIDSDGENLLFENE